MRSKLRRVRHKARDIRIANKIILPFLAMLFVVAAVTVPLISGWFEREIGANAERRLLDNRESIDLLIQSWERSVADSVAMLAHSSDPFASLTDRELLEGALSQEMTAHHLDFASVVMDGGDRISRGPAIESAPNTASEAESLSGSFVKTSEGWGVQYSLSADNAVGISMVSGGRLLEPNLLPALKQAAGDEMDVAFSVKGEVISASTTDPAGCNGCHEADNVPQLSGPVEEVRLRTAEMDKGSYQVLHGPLTLQGETVGNLSLLLPMDAVQSAQRDVRNVVYLAGALLFIAITLVGFFISRSITRPIARLAEVSQEIAGGNLSKEIEVGGNDEVGRLSKSVSLMTQNLANQLRELGLLHQISVTANSSLELEYILETLLDNAVSVLGADGGSIMLLQRGGTRLSVRVARGETAPHILHESVGIMEGPAGWVARHGRPLLLPEDKNWLTEERLSFHREIFSSVSVPIETRDSVLGVLNLNILSPERRFDRHTVAFARTLANHTAMSIEKARHHQEINLLYTGLIRALGSTIDAKDRYTFGHSEMVARYAHLIGSSLGYSEDQLKGLETAAYLHDIGKIGVLDAVLTKPDKLTPVERKLVEVHPVVGAQILEKIVFPWPVVDTVRHHHERWDGRGYPFGLAAHEIPVNSRILAVADSFDAMTSSRPYRPGRSLEEAIDELAVCSGSQFDPHMVAVFLEVVDQVHAALEGGKGEFPESHRATALN